MEQAIDALVAGLASGARGDLEAAFVPEASLTAVLPSRVRHERGRAAVASAFADWFHHERTTTVTSTAVETVGTTVSATIRALVQRDPGVHDVVQHLVATTTAGRLDQVRLVCTGFHPVADPRPTTTAGPGPAVGADHVAEPRAASRFDAGGLGCGDGLAPAFRRRLDDLRGGEVLTTVATDPVALEELPALARMLGHEVLSAARGPDGTVEVTVRRT